MPRCLTAWTHVNDNIMGRPTCFRAAMNGSKASRMDTYWSLLFDPIGGLICHMHLYLFQDGKKVQGGLLAVHLEGMRNIERHLRWQLNKLHLLDMVENSTPSNAGCSPRSTGSAPLNDEFLHSRQWPRKPVAHLLQRDGFEKYYSKSMDGFGTSAVNLSCQFISEPC